MNDGSNIHQVGVQVNFHSWQRFRLEILSTDGVLLFQYLSFHCQYNAQWTHSDKQVEYELGIGRRRLEALRKQFTDLGILHTQIVRDPQDNRIRAYRIKFSELTKLPVLRQLYRQQNEKGELVDLAPYVPIYRALAAAQPKLGTKGEPLQPNHAAASVKAIADQLVIIFDQRRTMYNDQMSKKTPSAGPLRLAVGTVKFSARHLRQLGNAVRAIDDTPYLLKAFTAYCDTLNAHSNQPSEEERMLLPTLPRDPLAYFLSYSTGVHQGATSSGEERGFNVIYTFGNYLAARYSRQAGGG